MIGGKNQDMAFLSDRIVTEIGSRPFHISIAVEMMRWHLNRRRREQQLAKEHQNEVDELTADNLRETQRILAEFNKAKELLKDKIEALQLLYVFHLSIRFIF